MPILSNKKQFVWFLARLALTGIALNVVYLMVSAASTVAVLGGFSLLVGILYYWLPNNEQWDSIKLTLEDLFNED